jgi:hypothetical protein
MATLEFDASKINKDYTRNTIYTNTVQLETPIKVTELTKVLNKTTDKFGSTRTATQYIIKPDTSQDFNMYSRALTKQLRKYLDGYEVFILTKKCEVWKEKGNDDAVESINAFRFVISIDHYNEKVWISVIFTQVTGQDNIDDYNEDGERIRTGDEPLIKVIGTKERRAVSIE